MESPSNSKTIQNKILLNSLKLGQKETISELESYLNSQVSDGTYHAEANRALLRLYSFHPSECNNHVVHLILVKALMNLPKNDLMMALAILPVQMLNDPIVSILRDLSEHLETAHFIEFWNDLNNSNNDEEGMVDCLALLDEVADFKDQIRRYIIDIHSNVYKTISLNELKNSLDLDEDFIINKVNTILDLKKNDPESNNPILLSSYNKIESIDDNIVTFYSNSFNQIKEKEFHESLSFTGLMRWFNQRDNIENSNNNNNNNNNKIKN